MKKIVFILVIIILVNAVSAELACSDRSKVEIDQNEIKLGSAKKINELGIGVALSDDSALGYRAELLIDAQSISLSNESSEINLISGKYSASAPNISSSSAIIKIDSESKTLELKDKAAIKGLVVMYFKFQNNLAEVLIGTKEIYLSSREKLSEKITLGNETYIIELFSASDSNAVVKVSKCETGEISEINQANNTTEAQQNSTNQTIQNNTEIRPENNTLNNTIQNNTLKNPQDNEEGFFQKIINWFKKILRIK